MTTHEFLFENISPKEQRRWCFVGMPEKDLPKGSGSLKTKNGGGFVWPWTEGFGGIWVRADLPSMTRYTMVMSDDRDKPLPYVWEPDLQPKATRVVPEFFIGTLGKFHRTEDVFDFKRSSGGALVTFHRYVHNGYRVTVDLDLVIPAESSSIEFRVGYVYGDTVNDGQPQEVDLPTLRMRSGGQMFDDFYVAQEREEKPVFQEGARKFIMDVRAGRWHRCREYEMRGWIETKPDSGRHTRLPIAGIYLGWDGHWGAIGKVPEMPNEVAVRERSLLLNRAVDPTPSMPRKSQPPDSGRTGEQETFGCFVPHATALLGAFECHSRLYDVQSVAMRVESNREPDGRFLVAENHPDAKLWNRRPEKRFNRNPGDMVGWKAPVEWIRGYRNADAQHRAYSDLHAMYLLTRDAAQERTMRNHVELDKLGVGTGFGGDGVPRAVGRTMLEKANLAFCGIDGALEQLQRQVGETIRVAQARWASHGGPMKTFFSPGQQAKYGWVNVPGGDPVIGLAPWQDSILVKGLIAAEGVLHWGSKIMDVAWELAKTVVDHAYYQRPDGTWDGCWGLAWNNGQAIPAQYYDGTINNFVYPFGHLYWNWVPVKLLAAQGYARAQEILPTFGEVTNMHKAQWWAYEPKETATT